VWVYGKRDLEQRVALQPATGFWLDYWLMLHAEETHPFWAVRPLTLANVAVNALLSTDNAAARALGQVTARDLDSYRRLGQLFAVPPPAEPVIVPSRRSGTVRFTDPWLAWAEHVGSEKEHRILVERLIEACSLAVRNEDYDSIAFYSRRLSSEISDDWPTARALLRKSRDVMLGQASDEPFEETLLRATSTSTPLPYTVKFSVSPVPVSGTVASARTGPAWTRLVIERTATADRTLIAIECDVSAADVEAAVMVAHAGLCDVLQQLRLRYYVRTHVYGGVEIAGDQEVIWAPLPQPFWNPDTGKRQVPRFPSGFHRLLLSQHVQQQARWLAAQWHVSRAIADWAEDRHAAASHVWQALESYAGSRGAVASLPSQYLPMLRSSVVRHLAAKVSLQASILRATLSECDWYYWVKKKNTYETWFRRVTDPGSTNYAGSWRQPTAPPILDHPRVGLLAVARNLSREGPTAEWATGRVLDDLDHLYALRNAAVHSGIRVGSARWATHVGRSGLEILLALFAQTVEATENEYVNLADISPKDPPDGEGNGPTVPASKGQPVLTETGPTSSGSAIGDAGLGL
jgi:hypothetical protein